MNRRQFVVALLTALPVVGACAGKALASRKPTGTIGGFVVGKGLRFGTYAKPLGREMFGIPNAPVHLLDAHSNVIAKTRTGRNGYFSFDKVVFGEYFVRVVNGDTKFVVVDAEIEYVGWFRRYDTK